MNEQEKKTQTRKNWIKGTIIILFGGIFIFVIIITYSPSYEIQLGELPLEKLNTGYDLVCKSRNHQTLCLYNETSRTDIKLSEMTVPDTKTNHTKNQIIYKISTKNQNCLNEFHVDWTNQTHSCFSGAYFPTDVWAISNMTDKNGHHILYAFYNGSNKK